MGTISDANDLLMMRSKIRPMTVNDSFKILMGISSLMGDVLLGNEKMTRLSWSRVIGVRVKAPVFTRGKRVGRGVGLIA